MEKSICCFIDILGYKDIICNSSDEENEENIKKLKNIYSQFERFNCTRFFGKPKRIHGKGANGSRNVWHDGIAS